MAAVGEGRLPISALSSPVNIRQLAALLVTRKIERDFSVSIVLYHVLARALYMLQLLSTTGWGDTVQCVLLLSK